MVSAEDWFCDGVWPQGGVLLRIWYPHVREIHLIPHGNMWESGRTQSAKQLTFILEPGYHASLPYRPLWYQAWKHHAQSIPQKDSFHRLRTLQIHQGRHRAEDSVHLCGNSQLLQWGNGQVPVSGWPETHRFVLQWPPFSGDKHQSSQGHLWRSLLLVDRKRIRIISVVGLFEHLPAQILSFSLRHK